MVGTQSFKELFDRSAFVLMVRNQHKSGAVKGNGQVFWFCKIWTYFYSVTEKLIKSIVQSASGYCFFL